MTNADPNQFVPIDSSSGADAPLAPESAPTTPNLPVSPTGEEAWRAYPQLMPGFDESTRIMRFWTSGDPTVAVGHLIRQLQAFEFRVTPAADGFSGAAEVGTAMKRFLLGGFARRNKLEYRLAQSPVAELFILEVQITMSGAGGGVIGYSKAKNENRDLYGALWNTLYSTGVVLYPSAATVPV